MIVINMLEEGDELYARFGTDGAAKCRIENIDRENKEVTFQHIKRNGDESNTETLTFGEVSRDMMRFDEVHVGDLTKSEAFNKEL